MTALCCLDKVQCHVFDNLDGLENESEIFYAKKGRKVISACLRDVSKTFHINLRTTNFF